MNLYFNAVRPHVAVMNLNARKNKNNLFSIIMNK